jgi:hypothetical protein
VGNSLHVTILGPKQIPIGLYKPRCPSFLCRKIVLTWHVAVFAYAQRRAPMISAVYANLPATGISSLIDYEWRQLLPQIEKDYWNDLCQKARRLYEETYCHRSPPTGLTSIPPATSPHTAAVNRSAGTNYVPQIITKKNPFPRTFSNQSILGTSQKVSNGTLHPSTQRSTHSLTRGSRGPRTSATSPSRPPPNLCKALPKRRKSSPRTMYEPNPVSYERSSTGRFVAIPPALTLPTLRAGMPLDIPRTISEPGPSSSDLGFGLQLSGHGLGSSTTSSHYSTSVIADTLKSPMSYYPNTTYPIQGPLHNYIVPMSSSYAPPVTTPPLNTFTNPMATVAIGPEY